MATMTMDLTKFDFAYDKKSDIFHLRLRAATEWVADDVDDFFILYDPRTGDPVGVMVENFRAVFLKKHPELQTAWNEANQPWRKWSKSIQDGCRQVFLGFFSRQAWPQMSMLLNGG